MTTSLWPLAEKLVKGPLTHFFFYAGDRNRAGIFQQDLEQYVHLFREIFRKYEVLKEFTNPYELDNKKYDQYELTFSHKTVLLKEIPESAFLPENWNPKTSFLFLPGGEATLIHKQIGHKLDQLREFWEQGGRIWAQCGSAYWLSRSRSYEFSPDQIKTTENPKALFPGSSRGPLRSTFDTSQPYRSSAPTIALASLPISTPTFLAGGGCFIMDSKSSRRFEPLAYYQDPNFLGKIAAVIGRHKLGGVVVLIHPHLNYQSADIATDELSRKFPDRGDWQSIKERLEGSEEKRMIMLTQIIVTMCEEILYP